ncbi:Hypothetical protein FKW44_007996 [Caligus rogercresseyi]|uniref:Uncharacterized protein n=1 Tax=Caligus rogercresseyi TaxID=217165 RepID=A0A7T8QTY9_CALRO|nr:Hypothetical protein FKW44_007996 [Caligus rogercresseyi]
MLIGPLEEIKSNCFHGFRFHTIYAQMLTCFFNLTRGDLLPSCGLQPNNVAVLFV